MKCTLRARRSNFAITSVARRFRQSSSAAISAGRLVAFFPDSVSVKEAMISPALPETKFVTDSVCASRPSPDAPCFAVLTL